MTHIELLAPAKDLECGVAAVDCGADAVYLGAPHYGAREGAGNTLNDIAALVRHAHRYWARVYVTLNTILRDDDIPLAQAMAERLYEAGIDGLIIQDTGLLECGLPPLPLIASTQMNNVTPEKVAFLEKVGFKRAILARELDLEQIRAIRQAAPHIELESFVHGALCVCYSGQCYLSYALGGRSGNRGQCAQPCRKPYTLVDARGVVLERSRHLLSLRDLNLSDHLREMLQAGVTSFKIEGRLKDKAYVANTVAFYRARLDKALAEEGGLRKSSSGASAAGFTPNPAKTFNRGYTTHFLGGRGDKIGSLGTPKMMGEALGRVTAAGPQGVTIDTGVELHPGDGLCFFNRERELCGTSVNAVQGQTVQPEKMEGLEEGTLVFRNHDHEFLASLRKARPERRIAVTLTLKDSPGGLTLAAADEDGVRAELVYEGTPEPAGKPEAALATIHKQLVKSGETEFACAAVVAEFSPVPFLPVSTLNAMRRELLEKLAAAREAARPREQGGITPNDEPYPERELSYLGNVLNSWAEAFYRRHGVTQIEPAAESGKQFMRGRKLMTTRYCLKHQLGLCPKTSTEPQPAEPLRLIDEEGHRLRLRFDCARCEMEIYLE